jgi:Carboxylesterase family
VPRKQFSDSGEKMKQHCLFVGVIAACVVALASPASAHSSPVINTIYGPVKGTLTPGVVEFLGVRYAAPPTGSLRWMPPQPPAPWSTPMDATQFGNACPQTGVAGVPSYTQHRGRALFTRVAERCAFISMSGGSLNSARR